MTSMREALRRLLHKDPVRVEAPAGFSYLVFWTKIAREWGEERRNSVRTALHEITQAPTFIAHEYRREYFVPELDQVAHSGASLLALQRVLQALGERSPIEG